LYRGTVLGTLGLTLASLVSRRTTWQREPGGEAKIEMCKVLRALGWLVMVGGPLTSVSIFWITPMNPALWALMAASVAGCVVLGVVLLWLGARLARSPLPSGD
jgi:hypothetical protein